MDAIAYSFIPATGEYNGPVPAQESPLEQDHFLLPANATFTPPPDAGNRSVACFSLLSETWEILPDYRTVKLYSTVTALPVTIDTIGPLPGEDTTEQVPPQNAVWVDGAWSIGPAPVPSSVTPLQARRAMRQAGVLDAVKAAVGTNPEMQDAFDYATSFNRESTFIAQAQALLQWTDAQIDGLFRLANTFTD